MKFMLAAALLVCSGAAAAQEIGQGAPPERDARGIPVLSAPPTMPVGLNQPLPATLRPGAQVVVADPRAFLTTRAASEDYPACTRERTDNCVQAYVGDRNRR